MNGAGQEGILMIVNRGLAWCIAVALTAGSAIPLTAQGRPDVSDAGSPAKAVPDFSGIWLDDNVRGSMRVIRQTAEAVEMTIFERRTDYVQQITINPWKYTFDRFAPRRGGENSREPQTQARWEGDTLVSLKSLGVYSIASFFTLTSSNEMLIEGLGHGVSPTFDFRRASLPRGYILDRSTFTRAPNSCAFGTCEFAIDRTGMRPVAPDAGGVTFLLLSPATVAVTCRQATCQVKNNNDLHPPVILRRGETTQLSILADAGQWAVPIDER
jgi:hypothetical protein